MVKLERVFSRQILRFSFTSGSKVKTRQDPNSGDLVENGDIS